MEKNIFINYGTSIKQMTLELLNAANVNKKIPPGARVTLKPNLVVPSPASTGATTHPEIVCALAEYLHDFGFNDIEIIEGSWYGDSTKSAFAACGYTDISRKYNIPLYDLKRDELITITKREEAISVCKRAYNAEYLINLPVMKAHAETTITCAVKNMKGCIPDAEKRRFHAGELHKLIAVLGSVIHQDLIIADAICPDLTFEGGGNPAPMGLIALCEDPLLMDTFAAHTLGASIDDIPYLKYFESFHKGVCYTPECSIIRLSEPTMDSFRLSGIAQRLSRHIIENGACSPCIGALIRALHRLDDEKKLNSGLRLHIGQHNRGKTISGAGIGSCCRGCSIYVPGCPPAVEDIIRFIDHL